MSFLKAEWRKLIMANYEVNPEVLKPYLPFGTEPELLLKSRRVYPEKLLKK